MSLNLMPIFGGALIGLSATVLLMFNGKVTGISGIFGGMLSGDALNWRVPFIIGLCISGLIAVFAGESLGLSQAFDNTVPRNLSVTALAGLLVGFGTRIGNGCTSGHGICGLSRGSKRSLIATISFMLTGIIAAYITQNIVLNLVS